MTASLIAQLLIQFGPGAIQLIESLVAVWSKPSLSPEEVASICSVAQKSYDQYIAEAGGTPVSGTTTTVTTVKVP